MKKTMILMLSVLLGVASAWARPALRGTVSVNQPDGTRLSLRLVGDEYLHYNTTADGFALVKDANGAYVYAQLDSDGQLIPTTLVAHDAAQRSAQELAFLQQTGQLKPQMSAQMKQLKQQNAESRRRAAEASRAQRYDYSAFKGLVLLVEYNDCQFQYDDYADIMQQMINQPNYTGEERTNPTLPYWLGSKTLQCTGSMRDYFYDNSNGIFDPTFDVVGPVQINRSQYFPGGKDFTGGGQLFVDACTAADSQVNFKDYDVNNDGVVDMIYFIFAGNAAYIQGNDPRLLWPHQSDLGYMRTRKDGVLLGRYACSTELFGYESYDWSILEGIGTMCHEFSHVLGLPDFYDTDNEYPGMCIDPGEWSVMANGADYNYGRTPCAYSLFERYALGFATPQLIEEPGSFSLENIGQSNAGYRINSQVKKEYFILENRQHEKWDSELPGHGMLVFRVDSTNNQVWTYNTVNDNPDHPYYELVRAGGPYMSGGYYYGTASDPFPGTRMVHRLDNLTTPANLRSWSGKITPLGLDNIEESNGVVTFDVFDANSLLSVTLVEQVMLGVGTSLQLNPVRYPDYAPYTFVWSSDNEQVATVTPEGVVVGISEGIAQITLTANESLQATCTVMVKNCTVADGIANFLELADDTEALLTLTNAQVLYSGKGDTYVRDATGSLILRGLGLTATKGNVLNGCIYGKKTSPVKMPVMTSVEGLTMATGITVDEGGDVEPVNVHISQLGEQYYANMVLVEKAQLVNDGGVYAVLGDKRYRLYNTLGITSPRIVVPTNMNRRYDITAIFGTNTLNGEVIEELYLLKSPTATTYVELTDISLPPTMVLPTDRFKPLMPELTPANADVFLTYASSDEEVATVNANGVLHTLASGTTTITVTNMNNGLQATTVLTVGDRTTAEDIAHFKALPLGGEADLVLNNAEVLFVKSNNAYVRDASGAIRFAATGLQLKAGDVLNGRVYGCYVLNNQMPELRPIEGSTNADNLTISQGGNVEPIALHISQLGDEYYANMVLVEKAQLVNDGGVFAVLGSKRYRLYNTLGVTNPRITVPTDLNKRYDITAIFGTNTLNGQIIDELYLLKSPTAAAYTELTGISLPATMQLVVGDETTLAPVLTPADADVFLTFASSDEQVATVGADGVLHAVASGSATITVTNVDNGLKAQTMLTVTEPRATVEDIAHFKALEPGSEAYLTLNNAQVLYTFMHDAYVRDATSAIRFASTGLQLKAGDVLNGRVGGSFMLNEQMPELRPIEGETNADELTITDGQQPELREVTVSQLTVADLADLIVLRNVMMQSVEGMAGLYVVDGDNFVRINNTFDLSEPFEGGTAYKFFDITGILTTAVVNAQTVKNLAMTQKPVLIQDFSGIDAMTLPAGEKVAVYDVRGKKVADTLAGHIGQLQLPSGIYLLKTATTTFKMVVRR
ncbi:MAG: M6 family metalloprotease domain-containing protein [Prevotella sp.]|nr:M6 family metalloprotease domain-containing protein [Prevotella sp.]